MEKLYASVGWIKFADLCNQRIKLLRCSIGMSVCVCVLAPALQWFVNFILVGFCLLAASCWQRQRQQQQKQRKQMRRFVLCAFYVCACHQHKLKVIEIVCNAQKPTHTQAEFGLFCIERSRVQVAIIALAQSNPIGWAFCYMRFCV